MAKVVKEQKPANKESIKLMKAILSENAADAHNALKALVVRNLKMKFAKADKEVDLF